VGNRKPHVTFLGPKCFHSKLDLDPFSRVCTAKLRDRQTDRLTDAHATGTSINIWVVIHILMISRIDAGDTILQVHVTCRMVTDVFKRRLHVCTCVQWTAVIPQLLRGWDTTKQRVSPVCCQRQSAVWRLQHSRCTTAHQQAISSRQERYDTVLCLALFLLVLRPKESERAKSLCRVDYLAEQHDNWVSVVCCRTAWDVG